jgi:hypothetical protein
MRYLYKYKHGDQGAVLPGTGIILLSVLRSEKREASTAHHTAPHSQYRAQKQWGVYNTAFLY